MSFSLTKDAILNRTKTVTRRLGWDSLQPGDKLNAVEKVMGLKKGEKVNVLARIRVVSIRREPLFAVTESDIEKEGFPNMSKDKFIAFFQKHMKCKTTEMVNRIEFEYLQ